MKHLKRVFILSILFCSFFQLQAQYCVPSSGTSDPYINKFNITTATYVAGASSISNENSGYSAGGYVNNSSTMAVSVYPGSSITFNAEIAGTLRAGIGMWVDWDKDMVLESSEIVYTGTGFLTGAVTGTFTVPASTAIGDYRMRVMIDKNTATPTNTSVPTSEASCIFEPNRSSSTAPRGGEAEDYKLTVVAVPTCPLPTALSFNSTSYTSATLDWTENGTATAWNIEWGEEGFTKGMGTVVAVATKPYVLTGLTAKKKYQYYVQANCGSGDLSSWTGPFNFNIDYCVPVSNSNGVYIDKFSTTNGVTNISNLNSGYGVSGYQDNSTTMAVAIGSGEAFDFSLETSGSRSVGLRIWVDWNKNLVFDATTETVFSPTSFQSSGTAITGTINVPAGTTLGDYYMRVLIDPSTKTPTPCVFSGSSGLGNGEVEDYKITVLRGCSSPTVLTANISSLTSATLGWTERGTATTWNIEWGAKGFTKGMGTTITGTMTNPYALTGLTAKTEYDFYVQSDCGSGLTSKWAGPFSFNTNYCTPSTSRSVAGIDNFSTTNGITNISNLNTGYSTGDYKDNSATMAVSTYVGGVFNFTADVLGGSTGCAIWVDWDNDLQFETNEVVFNTTAIARNFAGAITIPAGTPLGDYYMRVMVDINDPNPNDNPCDFENGRGEIEDYKLSVIATPSCLFPTDITTTKGSFTSVTLGWKENGTATTWNIEWGVKGFTKGSGTVVMGITTNPYNLTGLTPKSNYEFYLQSDCGNGTVSSWVGPLSFTTNYCVPSFVATTPYYIRDVETTLGTKNISNLNSGAAINSYGDYSSTQSVSSFPGGSFNFDVIFSGGNSAGCAIWIDWNNDLVFDATTENVFRTRGQVTPPVTGTITVPAGTTLGDYYMRIMIDADASSPNNPCEFSVGKGEVEDYKLEVKEKLSVSQVNLSKVSYFPNPISNTLTLNAKSIMKKVVVYDLVGKEVLTVYPNATTKTITMEALSKGIYFVKVNTKTAIQTLKVVKL